MGKLIKRTITEEFVEEQDADRDAADETDEEEQEEAEEETPPARRRR